MQKPNDSKQQCMPKYVSHLLGKKWVLPILEELAYEKDGIGFISLFERLKFITPREASLLLSQLVETGIVNKKNIKGSKNSKYSITELGMEFYRTLEKIKGLSSMAYEDSKGVNCSKTRCIECRYYARDYAGQKR